jgi:hypothetical protein
MTNDLNNIPVIVRDALQNELRVMHQAKVYEVGLAGGQTMEASYARQCMWRLPLSVRDNIEQALPLIEKLCQPSIVIVDLDDAGAVERITRDYFHFYARYEGGLDYYPNNQEASHACMKAALAALKDKP